MIYTFIGLLLGSIITGIVVAVVYVHRQKSRSRKTMMVSRFKKLAGINSDQKVSITSCSHPIDTQKHLGLKHPLPILSSTFKTNRKVCLDRNDILIPAHLSENEKRVLEEFYGHQ